MSCPLISFVVIASQWGRISLIPMVSSITYNGFDDWKDNWRLFGEEVLAALVYHTQTCYEIVNESNASVSSPAVMRRIKIEHLSNK